MTLNPLRCLVLLFTLISVAFGGDPKSRYDIQDEVLLKGTTIPFLGWKLNGQSSALTVLPGFYCTWGTMDGKSASPLDNAQPLLFGHPYAKTSFPMVSVDGQWKRAEELFPVDSFKVSVQNDSLLIVKNSAHGSLTMEVTYRRVSGGTGFHCTMRLINKTLSSKMLSLGHVLDPSIGKHGDAVVTVNGNAVSTDTSFSESMLMLSEKNGAINGIRASVEFDGAIAPTTVIRNWSESADGSPAFVPGEIRRLYDVVLQSFWEPVSVASADTLVRSFSLSLLAPNFGASVFTRWDVPRYLSMEDGMMHPLEVRSMASVYNSSVLSSTVTLQVANNNYVGIPSKRTDTSTFPQQMRFVPVPISFKEIYENVVVDLDLLVSVNSTAYDTLTVPVFIPATPVSDTGLTVMFDSLIVAAKPKISAIFEVARSSTGQKFFSLKPENVFLYENDNRIRNFTMQKDTTGGIDALDLVFILDVTGSMGNTINGVKDNIIEFTDSLKKQGVDFRLGMVTFLDEIENVYQFVTDPETFKGYVAAQFAHGGGDGPENSLDALFRAAQFPFRNDAKRVFIWITDISYHESDWATARTKAQVIEALLQNDITVHAVGPTAYKQDWYNPIIEPTGGNFYDIGGKFRDVLLDISRMKTTSKFLLSYQSPMTVSGQRTVKLEIHVAGLGGTASAVDLNPGAADGAEPLACFPNPFNPQTTIRVQLPVDGTAAVTIYNLLGQQTRRFEIASQPGTASIVWDATDNTGRPVASGMYIIRAEVLSRNGSLVSAQSTKVIYLK